MTHRFFFYGLLAAAVSCAAEPDVEPTAQGSAPLRGWFLSGASLESYRGTSDLDVHHGGRASGRLEFVDTEEPDAGAGTLMQSIPADPYRGRRLRMSAFVRTKDVERWAGLWMRIDRPEGRSRFDNMQSRPIVGTTEWSRYEVVLDVPDDAASIHFGIVQDGPGTSWIDDVSLEPVGSDVASTAIELRPLSPADPGFEGREGALSDWIVSGVAHEDFEATSTEKARRSGARGARLAPKVERPRGQASLAQSIQAEPYLGKRLRLSVWLKGQAIEEMAGLHVVALAADAPQFSPGLARGACARDGSFDWQSCSVVLDVPSAADSIDVELVMQGRGELFADDLSIEEVSADVPLSQVDGRPTAIVDPSIEPEGDQPAGWFVSGGARSHYAARTDRDVAFEGRSSLRVEPTVPEPQGYGTVMQNVRAAAYRGHRWRLTAMVRGRGVDKRGDFWLRVQAADSPGDGAGLGGGACTLSGDFDWRPCEIVFDVPARGDALQFGVGTTGHGRLWVDALRLEKVDPTTPLSSGAEMPRTLANGHFEAPGAAPVGWFLSGGAADGYRAVTDREQWVSGNASVRLEPRSSSPSGYGTLMQSVRAEAYRGKRMRMRAQLRGESIASGNLWLRVQAPSSAGDGPGLGGGHCDVEGSFGWRPCEVVFEVPQRAASIQVGIGLKGAGKAWLDDVVLEEVDRGVPTTGEVSAGVEPQNLGFEL